MSQTTITLLFLVFTIISFILEKIPLGLTASICAIGLTLTGVVDATTTFSQYVNSNVILCVGMFVVGQALFETGMANKIGGLVTKFASSSWRKPFHYRCAGKPDGCQCSAGDGAFHKLLYVCAGWSSDACSWNPLFCFYRISFPSQWKPCGRGSA